MCCVGNDTDTKRNKVGRSLQHNKNKVEGKAAGHWGEDWGDIELERQRQSFLSFVMVIISFFRSLSSPVCGGKTLTTS